MNIKYPELNELEKLSEEFHEFQRRTIPLCAAETVISDFVKEPLAKDYQERYIMGSAYDFTMDDNFIGAQYLLPYLKMIGRLGSELFHAKYTDARTLTGMNAANMLVTALSKPGDNIMIMGKEWGGHASMKPTFQRLGLNVFEAPYDLSKYDFDYDALNKDLRDNHIKFFNIAPSDLISPHEFKKIEAPDDCILLFDYSQLLGLIAAGLLDNPLDSMPRSVLYGGTHKTMPGPAHGIIMTNDGEIYAKIDKEINPKYLRNIQTHQVLSLLHCMVEMKYFGKAYQENTVRIGNLLGEELEKRGLPVVKFNGAYTRTHQLFMEMDKDTMMRMFNNALKAGVTLNTKKKPLFHGGYGIRLGLQELSRYGWPDSTLSLIADVLVEISKGYVNFGLILDVQKTLPEKKCKFTFSDL